MKEKLNKVIFNTTPQVRVRVIETNDKKADEKKKFPFKLDNDVIVTIDSGFSVGRSEAEAVSKAGDLNAKNAVFEVKDKPVRTRIIQDIDERRFSFKIKKNYIWNGADIPRCFWRLIGSRTDNAYLKASMVHDFMLEHKKYIMEETLKNSMSVKEYRRITSLIFRQILKDTGTNTIKANVMSWCVDVFQMTLNRKGWKL